MAEQIRYRSEKGHTGDMIFRGTNPAAGALVDFWLAEEGTAVTLTVLSGDGERVASIPASGRKGINRTNWNLRYTEPDQEPDPIGLPVGSGGGQHGAPQTGVDQIGKRGVLDAEL